MRGFAKYVVLIGMALVVGGCSRSEPPSPQAPASDKQQTAALPQATTASPVVETASSPVTSPRAPGRPAKIDACTLLSSKEIQQVQREALKETKPSGSSAAGLSVAQCFFTLPTFTNSISLAVTQRGDGPDARDPKGFWKEKFRGYDHEREKDKDRDQSGEEAKEEEDEESVPPLKIAHVGDEAFWTGSAVGGALYVLKGNAFVRVSIGGSGSQQSKINRSKALAQLVLKHL